MKSELFADRETVGAALAGDEQARAEVADACLKLVYNVVGRAAEPDLDVDDIVQDTMVGVVRGLGEVRDPERLRAWVITVAFRRLAEARERARDARLARAGLDGTGLAGTGPEGAEPAEVAGPEQDIAEHLLLRESLTHEQRQVASATRWLDPGYRELLSLWWLETCGRLTRADLAEALELDPPRLAVRVQRLKEQLATCRRVVRVLETRPRCPGLATVTGDADPRPTPLLRKRTARHLRTCAACGGDTVRPLVPPERLLVGMPLLVPPAGLGAGGGVGASTGAHAGMGTGSGPAAGHPAAHAAPRGTSAHVVRGAHAVRRGLTVRLPGGLGSHGVKAVVAGLAVAVVLAGAGVAAVSATGHGPGPASVAAASTASPSATRPRTAPPGTPPATSRPSAKATSRAAAGTPRASKTSKAPASPKAGATFTGILRQNSAVASRDNGQSVAYGGRSVWFFDDTILRSPWGFLSSSAAATTDLDASDGITLTSRNAVTTTPGGRPADLIPKTAAERRFEAAHDKATGCTAAQDPYCGAKFGFWPGTAIADPARHRILVFFGKLCRGGADGTPCSGPLGKGLGTGIAAVDMTTGAVTRTVPTGIPTGGPAVRSVEGVDPTMLFPEGTGYSAASLAVGGTTYVYGDCDVSGCRLGRVPLASITDRAAWRFRTRSGWSTDPGAAVPLIAPGAAGQTVFPVAALHAYVNVYMPYGTNDVDYQVGASPTGPWSRATTAFTVPGGKRPNYALFAHPEYARDGGLTQYLTYFNPNHGTQNLVTLRLSR